LAAFVAICVHSPTTLGCVRWEWEMAGEYVNERPAMTPVLRVLMVVACLGYVWIGGDSA
jgi:hypothetical protein